MCELAKLISSRFHNRFGDFSYCGRIATKRCSITGWRHERQEQGRGLRLNPDEVAAMLCRFPVSSID